MKKEYEHDFLKDQNFVERKKEKKKESKIKAEPILDNQIKIFLNHFNSQQIENERIKHIETFASYGYYHKDIQIISQVNEQERIILLGKYYFDFKIDNIFSISRLKQKLEGFENKTSYIQIDELFLNTHELLEIVNLISKFSTSDYFSWFMTENDDKKYFVLQSSTNYCILLHALNNNNRSKYNIISFQDLIEPFILEKFRYIDNWSMKQLRYYCELHNIPKSRSKFGLIKNIQQYSNQPIPQLDWINKLFLYQDRLREILISVINRPDFETLCLKLTKEKLSEKMETYQIVDSIIHQLQRELHRSEIIVSLNTIFPPYEIQIKKYLDSTTIGWQK